MKQMSSGQFKNVCQPVLSICIPLQYQLPTYSLPLIPFFSTVTYKNGTSGIVIIFLSFLKSNALLI